jgi:putative phage-type endonuclease
MCSSWVKRLDEIHRISDQHIKSNTPEWYNARRGRLTASSRSEGIHESKGLGMMKEEIERELSDSWERNSYDNVAMAWGRQHEPGALAALELETGLDITDPGLIFHPELPFVAATPDGFAIDPDGRRVSIQIKCPYNPDRHLDNVYGGGRIKQQYWFQVQWEAWLLDASRIIFASYDPRQPLKTQLGIIDVPVVLDTRRRFEENSRKFQRYVDGEMTQSGGKLSVLPGHIPEVF